jgi:hypothetical protein
MKELETIGYVIIPDFLNNETIDILRKNYLFQKEIFLKNYDKNGKHNIISGSYNLDSIFENVRNNILEQTNLKIGNPAIHHYFDNQITKFVWHQDHACYFEYPDSYNAVNFWIPIIRKSLTKSGISFVPHNRFYEKYPKIFERHIKGKGAKIFKVLDDGNTLMRDDAENLSIVLPFDINDLAITPTLNEGDLLILRQDVVHRTQDSDYERVAVSVRCYSKYRNQQGI